MNPRHYQSDGLDAVLREFEAGNDTLLVRPTGMGKTVELAHVLKNRPGRAIVMAHREELIFQNAQKVEAVTGETCEIEMAEYRADVGSVFSRSRLISASVQTLNAGRREARMDRFNPHDFRTLVIDEAHHAPSDSYRRVVEYFKQNPDLRVLGLTATPDRADEMALGSVFDTVAHEITIEDAIQWGWLVDIECVSVHVDGLDYNEVRTTAGDLNGGDLERVMMYESNLQRIALPTIEIIEDKRTLVFAASVAHAERLCEIFNRYKPGSSQWLCGKTPKPERKDILRSFASGNTQVVVNVGVLTEGFDDPGIECVVLARPTKSRSLYCQMIGRGTRPLPGITGSSPAGDETSARERRDWIAASGKPTVRVIDFVGNATRHRLVHAADILGGDHPEPVRERAIRLLQESSTPMPIAEAYRTAEEELALEEEERKQREAAQQRKREEEQDAARRALVRARADYTQTAHDPFRTVGLSPKREMVWDTAQPPTEKMVSFLKQQGVPQQEIARLNRSEAGVMVGELKARLGDQRCSFKQARLLQKYKLPTEVSRTQASEWIDAIAKNDWKRPEGIGPDEPRIKRY